MAQSVTGTVWVRVYKRVKNIKKNLLLLAEIINLILADLTALWYLHNVSCKISNLSFFHSLSAILQARLKEQVVSFSHSHESG